MIENIRAAANRVTITERDASGFTATVTLSRDEVETILAKMNDARSFIAFTPAPKPRERTALGITKAQQQALKRIYLRGDGAGSYLTFRRTAKAGYDCVMLPWCGMWLGIESDGYTHS